MCACERRHAARTQDPEYREACERAAREIAQTDAVIRELDAMRVDLGISKAELAGGIGGPAVATQVDLAATGATFANGLLYVSGGVVRRSSLLARPEAAPARR
jgi:hypothetical protein